MRRTGKRGPAVLLRVVSGHPGSAVANPAGHQVLVAHRGAIAVALLSLVLSGCAGTVKSSRAIYPENWPALANPGSGRECPDLSGTYLSLSDEAPPLVYPVGGQPSRMILAVPYGGPVPLPTLGKRVLTWHLAGMRAELRGASIKAGISFKDYEVQWDALARYAALVEADAMHADGGAGTGLVKIQEMEGGVLEVHAGIRDRNVLNFRVKKYTPQAWTYQNSSYKCQDGGLLITSYFLPPDVENPAGLSQAYSDGTFYRAVDGSLVMLEESSVSITNAYTSPFQKWWRWQPVNQ